MIHVSALSGGKGGRGNGFQKQAGNGQMVNGRKRVHVCCSPLLVLVLLVMIINTNSSSRGRGRSYCELSKQEHM